MLLSRVSYALNNAKDFYLKLALANEGATKQVGLVP